MTDISAFWVYELAGDTIKLSPFTSLEMADDYVAVIEKRAGCSFGLSRVPMTCEEAKKAAENLLSPVRPRLEKVRLEAEAEAKKQRDAIEAQQRSKQMFWMDRPHVPYLPPESPIIRNLLFHVWPLKDRDHWKWHAQRLMESMPLFNGRKYVAIATGNNTEDPEKVMDAFGGPGGCAIDEFFVAPNDPSLREVATFDALFGAVNTLDPHEVTFYCHSKGMQTPDQELAGSTRRRWAVIMYSACLDYWREVEVLFQRFPVVGNFRISAHAFGMSKSDWHYSGSFFWFNNRSLFSREWQGIDRHWFGIETYPSMLFYRDEAGVIFGDGPKRNLYDFRYFTTEVEPEWETWKREHP